MRSRRTVLLVVFLLLAALFLVVRCRPPSGSTEFAVLTYVNEAGSSWRISMADTSGGAARSVRIAPLGETRIELPPGRYLVSQTLVDIHGTTLDRRETQVKLEKGRTYRWRLLSLQSQPPAGGSR